MGPAVDFFASLGAGVAGVAALLRPAEVRAGVYRLEGIVATAALALAATLATPAGSGTVALVSLALAATAAAVAVAVGGSRPGMARAALGVAGGLGIVPLLAAAAPAPLALASAATATASLGTAAGAMLLGHWYLVDRGMRLDPLHRLALAYSAASGARLATLGTALACRPGTGALFADAAGFLRGGGVGLLVTAAFGMVLPPLLAAGVHGTLRVPNTQSATGLLYVAVIAAIIADLAARGAGL